MKDNFSLNSEAYFQYRPHYPDSFFNYLGTLQPEPENAWDCGTGNGQVARKLAGLYKNVYASDISQAQLDKAVKLTNITYSVQPAENTNFPNNFFDLIVVAQAVHWLDFDKFYAEVTRTAKDKALLVIIGYGRFNISNEIDILIDNFYHKIIGSYWDEERKYIDEHYQTLPFPFNEFMVPPFENTYNWPLDHVIGYLKTWSAVKHFLKDKGYNPVDLIYDDLKKAWGKIERRKINFPLLLRIGKIQNSRK
jgi:ubiquinone/menaquinone biosynthesis C-methylase UbiE